MTRALLDAEGENLALRTFLLLYGSAGGCTITDMRKHMKRSGWDGCWPAWAAFPADGHLTKAGAQLWIRHLISLEQVPLVRAPLPMTQERFNEKMAALDAANPAPLVRAQAGVLTAAAADVLAERQRQIEGEGWSLARDDGYVDCELARAAATFALCTAPEQIAVLGVPAWPWSHGWFKPAPYRRQVVKAAALLLAEIERLDRAAAKGGA